MRVALHVDPAWPGRALAFMAVTMGLLALLFGAGGVGQRGAQGLAAAAAALVVLGGMARRRRMRR